jgi:hypothetical protein
VTAAVWPNVTLWADFNNTPLGSHGSTVVDISADLISFQTSRGRQTATSTFDTGTCTILLDNTLGKYGPTYTQTPYATQIQPMVWMRLWSTITATPIIFEGYVEGYTIQTSGTGTEVVLVTLADAFKILNLFQFTGGNSSGTTDQRIQEIEIAAGFSSLGHSDTGLTTVPAILAPQNLNGLQHCQDCADTEDGQFYIGMNTPVVGNSGFVFENRYHRANATRSTTSQATFSDDGTGTIDYEDGQEFPYDDSEIWTTAIVTDGNEDTFAYTDPTSAGQYLNRTQTIQILTTTPNEGYDRAAWIVQSSNGQLDQVRIDQMVTDPVFAATAAGSTSLWTTMLSLDISDRVTIKRTAPASTLHGAANQISGDFFIEHIEHDCDLTDHWTITYSLSPVSQTAPNWAVLGTMHLGSTGGANTAVLGY